MSAGPVEQPRYAAPAVVRRVAVDATLVGVPGSDLEAIAPSFSSAR